MNDVYITQMILLFVVPAIAVLTKYSHATSRKPHFMQQTTNMNLIMIAASVMLLQQTLVALAACKARVLHALHYSNMYFFPFVFLSVMYLVGTVQRDISATSSVLVYSKFSFEFVRK